MNSENNIKHIMLDLSYFMVQRGHVFKDLSYNGRPTGIYYGILKLVQGLHTSYPKCNIHICRDGLPLNKRVIYPAYKANRDEVSYKPSKDYSLIKNLQKMVVSYPHVYVWLSPEYEADDLIASLVMKNPEKSIILSGDNDFLQLMCKGVRIAKTIKNNKFELRTEDYIQQKYGVTPDKLLTFRALQGDKSDNITGVIPTRKIREIVNKDKKELIDSLSPEEFKLFKRNLTLMSLKQFKDNPIHTKPLDVKPDLDLFKTFGLEKLMYRKEDN